MNKLVKVILGVIIVLIVLVLVVALTLPFTISPIVKTAAATLGPQVLGVPVSVGKVSLNPFAGRMIISRLSVGNPQGYSDNPAFAANTVDIDLKMTSLLGDVIVVEKILVEAPLISYETRDGVSNFDTVQANAKKSSDDDKAPRPADAPSAEIKAGKKVIIELFTLNSARVSYVSALTLGKSVTLPLPSVTVKDIGKDSGGTPAADAAAQIVNAVAGGLGQAVTAAASQTAGALQDALKGSDSSAKGATNILHGVAQGMSGAAKGATNAAAKATDSLKKFFKSSVVK